VFDGAGDLSEIAGLPSGLLSGFERFEVRDGGASALIDESIEFHSLNKPCGRETFQLSETTLPKVRMPEQKPLIGEQPR
jgi:hypothetical protein